MRERSSNLAIMFTDIVGYTEATASRSRTDGARLLHDHNQIMYPLAKRFRGEVVKCIGDGLLIVFSSPTDALLCSMAMQDALHMYNSERSPPEQMHIRIAVNVGEVRRIDGDVLGDPVNVASRIEKLTPSDQIYFSEAVYMTMNKAEVPAKEVGAQLLKGVSDPVRLYMIPPFYSSKLIPADQLDPSSDKYPFGGWHLRKIYPDDEAERRSTPFIFGTVAASVLLLVLLGYVNLSKNSAAPSATTPVSLPIKDLTFTPEIESLPRPPIGKRIGENLAKFPPQERFPQLKELKKREALRMVEERYRRGKITKSTMQSEVEKINQRFQ